MDEGFSQRQPKGLTDDEHVSICLAERFASWSMIPKSGRWFSEKIMLQQ
jgi:hypothetical protein